MQNDRATPINLYNDIDNIQTWELPNNNNELNEGYINTNNGNINFLIIVILKYYSKVGKEAVQQKAKKIMVIEIIHIYLMIMPEKE